MTDSVEVSDGSVRGHLHSPAGQPVAAMALTHGAGGNCAAKVLVEIARHWSSRGVVVLRFDMAFRQERPKGPPHPSKAEADRNSVRAAVEWLREQTPASLFVGGHSYGGRQASMVVAEDTESTAGLVAFSYPLHPPGKPDKLRTEHLPGIDVPSLFVSGSKDPFGTPSELRRAVELVGARTEFVEIAGAGHDLSPAKYRIAETSFDRAEAFFGWQG